MKESKIYGSLVRRVVLVFLTMVILPLLLYMGILWERDWKIKLRSAFSEMELMGKFSVSFLEEWYSDAAALIDILAKVPPQDWDFNPFFSTFLVMNEQGVCTHSNRKELIGKQFEKASELAGFLTILEKRELFLFQKKGTEIWGLGADLAKWKGIFSRMKKVGYPAVVSFESPKKEELIQLNLSQLERWKRKAGLFEGVKLRGKEITLVLPVPNAKFSVFVSLSAEEINNYAGGAFFTHILFLIGFLVVIGGVGTIWITRRMARPFHQLYKVMQGVQDQDYAQKYESDRFGFEINVLGNNFNQMLQTLLENVQASKELEVGRSVQNQLLPKTIPEFPGLSIGKGFIPAKEVAGDFYDLFVRGKNELLLAIADGSDKGVSACLYSLMVRSLLRSSALAGESLERIIQQTNNLFCRDTGDTGNFVTAFVGIYQGDTHTLRYTSAGHLPAIFINPNGELQELTTKGIALGAIETEQVEVKSVSFSPGSLLFLYSDGITEAHNEKGELFGKSRLLEFISTHRDLESQKLIDRLLEEVNAFAGDSAQHDDLTVVCVKVY